MLQSAPARAPHFAALTSAPHFASVLLVAVSLLGCSSSNGNEEDPTDEVTEATDESTEDTLATDEQTGTEATDERDDMDVASSDAESTDDRMSDAGATSTDSAPSDGNTSDAGLEQPDAEATDVEPAHPGAEPDANAPPPDLGDVTCDEAAACGLVECEVPQLPGYHVETCSELAPHSNPPTSGEHYPSWAQFGIYEQPIITGFLLHTLEHSAVALLYNCDLVEARGDSCEELVDELLAFYDDFPLDPLCTDVPHRLVIAPDPDLDVPFAAAAWGYYLKGDCFDAERVGSFIDAHYGNNYEDLCNTGIDPSEAGCEP